MNRRLASLTLILSLAAPALALAIGPTPEEAAKDAEKLALMQKHAGESRETVRFLRPIHSIEVLGAQNVVVWETPYKAWLVDLKESAACNHLEREYALGIDSRQDTMNTRNAYVTGRDGLSCKITQIREVDVPAMKADERGELAANEG